MGGAARHTCLRFAALVSSSSSLLLSSLDLSDTQVYEPWYFVFCIDHLGFRVKGLGSA